MLDAFRSYLPYNGRPARWQAHGIHESERMLSKSDTISRVMLVLAGPIGFAAGVGFLQPLGAVATSFAAPAMGWPDNSSTARTASYVLFAPVVPLLMWAGWWIRRHARRRIRIGVDRLVELDRRAPILFLRAFRDDQVAIDVKPGVAARLNRLLLPGLSEAQTIDHMATEGLWSLGPVVALGNPDGPVPHYGAIRAYPIADWRQVVRTQARAARAIIVCVDATAGVSWELQHLQAEKLEGKTLYLVPPKLRAGATASIDPLLAEMAQSSMLDASRILGWFECNDGSLNILTSTRSDCPSYQLAINLFRTEMERRGGS